MTGYTVHTGANKKFTEGWDRIFKTSGAKKAMAPVKTRKPAAAKKTRSK